MCEQPGGLGDDQHVADVRTRHAEAARERGNGDRQRSAGWSLICELPQNEAAHHEQPGIALGQFCKHWGVVEHAETRKEIRPQLMQEGGAKSAALQQGRDQDRVREDRGHGLELPDPLLLLRCNQFLGGNQEAPAMIGRIGSRHDVAAKAHGSEDRGGTSGTTESGTAAQCLDRAQGRTRHAGARQRQHPR